jgi:O-antigen/teichoic acid export membrane protein
MEAKFARFSLTTVLRPFQGLRSLLVSTPTVSESDPAPSGDERARRVTLTVVVSVVSRAISILTMLISIPLTINYLGSERYGMWMTMTAILLSIRFADFGIGNGLIDAVAETNGRDDPGSAHVAISSATFMLLILALTLGVGFLVAYPFVAWHRIFNVSSPIAVAESGPSLLMLIISFLILLPLTVSEKVQAGYQEGFYAYLWLAISSVLSLVMTLLVIFFRGGLIWLVFAEMGPKLLLAVLNGVHLFAIKRPWLLPSWKAIQTSWVIQILHSGVYFFMIQVAGILIISSDNIIIAQELGPEAVTRYSVPMKMFNIVPTILFVAASASWPAYSEALIRGDLDWAKRTYHRSIWMTVSVGGVAALGLLTFGHWIILHWAGPKALPEFSLLASIALWAVLFPLSYVVTFFLSGAGALRFRTVCEVSACLISFPLKFMLIRVWGLPGVPMGTLIAMMSFSIIPSMIYIYKYLRSRGRHVPSAADVAVSSV